jgi:glycosyltransferase involved in cell wall biosynthesis
MEVPPIGQLRNPNHSISVVIPVLNDALALSHLLPRLAAQLGSSRYAWEIVVVDDGSTDHLAEVVGAFATSGDKPNVQLVQLSRNFGKECALTAGLEAARGTAVICMDGDGQHPPQLIGDMLRLWEAGHAMVIGVQDRRLTERRWLVKAKNWFYRYLQTDGRYQIPPHAGDFRLMDRRVVNALLRLPERARFMKGMYAWVGFKTAHVRFNAPARTAGETKFKPRQLMDLAVCGITSFSVRPLRMVARIGLGISAAALLYGSYVVLNTLYFGNPVSGWATLAAGMMLLSGIQLVCLGVMAEYLGRVFEEAKQRPLYIVADHVDYSRLPGTPALADVQRHPAAEGQPAGTPA